MEAFKGKSWHETWEPPGLGDGGEMADERRGEILLHVALTLRWVSSRKKSLLHLGHFSFFAG